MLRRLPLDILLALLLVAGALAGCVETPPDDALGTAGQAAGPDVVPPAVIAVVDTGVNVYHEAFRGTPTFADVVGFPEDAPALRPTLDAASYDAAVEADAAAWSAIAPQQLVRFEGTRLAGISFGTTIAAAHLDDEPTRGAHPILDAQGHGTVTTHAALEAAPHAVAVMVQVEDDEQLVEAMRWIAQQPWIDIVTVSMGTWAEEYAMGEARMGLAPAYREAARAGKLIFNAAGNEPLPHLVGEHSGPPFVVAVGGAQNETRGDTRVAARFPDVVGAFLHPSRAQVGTLDEYAPSGGTSLSCPLVAGTAAEALWLARAGGASPTPEELRSALQRRADLWGPTDWSVPELGDWNEMILSNPVLLGPAQIGWGHVEAAHATDIAAHLLGELALPEKSFEVDFFMDARQEARRVVWGPA